MVFGTGNKVLVAADYEGSAASPLQFVRTYNSIASSRSPYDLAANWSIGILRSIVVDSLTSPSYAAAVRPDGKNQRFDLFGAAWKPDADVSDVLSKFSTGWRYWVAADNSVEDYDANGLLLKITRGDGAVQLFSHSNGSGGVLYGSTAHASGYVAPACTRPSGFSTPATSGVALCVTDGQGRQLNFSYDGSGRLNKFSDPAGRLTQYTFDGANNLSTVTFPDTKVLTYVYNESVNTGGANLPHALTGIIDEKSVRFATYQYDSSGKAVAEALAGGADSATFSFGTNSTTVADALGTARTYGFQDVLGVTKSTGSSQPGGSGCASSSSALTYDANGNVASRTDFSGNKTCYAHDMVSNLETKRVENLSVSADCTAALAAPPSPTTANPVRTVSTRWHSYWRAPTSQAEASRLTTNIFNGDTYNGSVVSCAAGSPTVPSITSSGGTQPIGVLCRQIEQGTIDSSGSQGFAGTSTDASFSSVTLLLHGDGTNGSTYFPDSSLSPKVSTPSGNAQIGTAQSKFGGSIALDGSGDYLTIPTSTDFDLGNVYTVEAWIRPMSFGGGVVHRGFYSTSTSGWTGLSFSIRMLNSGGFRVYFYATNNSDEQYIDTSGISANVWTHIAMVRNGTTGTVYLNGVLAGTKTGINTVASSSQPVLIGNWNFSAGDEYFTGNIDEVRITKGVARYTAAFTPDAGAFADALLVDPAAATRTTSYTYDAGGRVLTVKDPTNNLTTYAYYSSTSFTGTDPNAVGHTVGDLQSVTNAAGHVTQFTSYDKAGRVLQMVDPKGVTTGITYTPRGWVSTVAVTPPGLSARTTSYTYDAAGQVTAVAMPDGSSVGYTYDAAHRLTRVTDAKGNYVAYTLDNMGNRTTEEVKDPGGTLQRSISRSFDALNRMQRVTGTAQ